MIVVERKKLNDVLHGLCGFLLLLLVASCSNKKEQSSLFQALNAEATGLHFKNELKPTSAFNLFNYMYYYNGAGVGAGDLNRDGKIDLFFAANQGPNRLFINEGGMRFKDVTETVGLPQDGSWSTGVSLVDINNDGLLDIYICRVGQYKTLQGRNVLLVCQDLDKSGLPTYKDEAPAYGLAFSGFSTQAAFFDFDGDQDLDLFLLNHSVNHDGNYAPRSQFAETYDSLAGHRMYRNDTKRVGGKTIGSFTDITKTSGINSSRIGYGLGVVASDINSDGWMDLYVGNDFHENDYLYINQKNGTFKDEAAQRLMHTSQFSMGVDAADVNNDALPDIVSMDMLPGDPYMLRRSLAEDDHNIFYQKIAYGYNFQYARNNLQLQRPNGLFSEVGQYAGIYATDWSWASLWMDFDNDGRKDLFVSNGIPRRMNDIDYINFVSNEEVQQKLRSGSMGAKDMALVEKFPEIKIPNRFFLNKGDVRFADMTDSIGSNPPTFSNGAAYADLDSDGDLDIVVNNINDKPVIYQNNTQTSASQNSFVSLRLQGDSSNINAVGANVFVYAKDGVHRYEFSPVRGFLSSMLGPMLIGLRGVQIDSALVVWPDGGYQRLIIQPDTTSEIKFTSGLPRFDWTRFERSNATQILSATNEAAPFGLNFIHQENRFQEFDREPLLPYAVSSDGPALAVADINGDGLEDVFVGGSKTFKAATFLQIAIGVFKQLPQPAMALDSMWEGVDATWADVNGDRYPDLIVATGGNEYYGTDEHLAPLLYLNDGKGNLAKNANAFPNIRVTQSCVAAHDFNGDGAVDLFFGGRSVPWAYGETPPSYLLQNDGKGGFRDITDAVAPGLKTAGMITSARWSDVSGDGINDLVLTKHWGGIDAFVKKENGFVQQFITTKGGWWNTVLPVDLDGDGDLDLVAGNAGLNSKLHAPGAQPVTLYYDDFDRNGKKEQLLTYRLGGEEVPFATKQQLEKQMPSLKKKFLLAEDFAKADLKTLAGDVGLSKAGKLEADYFNSAIFINGGNMQFVVQALPWTAQLSTYRTAIVVDANGDNKPDVLLGGNFYESHVELGRNDADFGTVLINEGKNNFSTKLLPAGSMPGQVRHLQNIKTKNGLRILAARNNDSLLLMNFLKPVTKKTPGNTGG